MKILAVLFVILLICSLPVTASPASPIWSASIGMDELNSYYFSNDFEPINKLFRPNGTKILMLNSPTVNGARYSIGYGVSRKNLLGSEQKIFAASVNKKLTDNWSFAVGFESDRLRFGAINFGAMYSISPHATISVFTSINNKEYDLKKPLIRTQLLIFF
jgi:hypothetical protein